MLWVYYQYTRIGKFNADKAKELGIPCRIWNKLQHGQAVEHEGVTYTPDMVMGALERHKAYILHGYKTSAGNS